MAVIASNSHILCRELYHRDQQSLNGGGCCSISIYSALGRDTSSSTKRERRRRSSSTREVKAEAFWQDVSSSKPTTIDMEAITSADHLDQILVEAKELSQSIIIDWMANWCRKCIYLKPKLEKLAAEFHTKIKFYTVDVNNVSQTLVKRGNISKMPTIQLWKDGEMKAEVIGGHKAWLVVDEVREMIQKYM